MTTSIKAHADTGTGRGRRIGFLVLAGLLAVFAGLATEGIPSLVRGWMATGGDVIHRIHDIQHGVFMGLVGVAVFASQLRWPSPAGAQSAGLLGLTFVVAMVGGQVFEVPVAVFLAVVGLFLALHPDRARLLSGGRTSRPLAVLAAVGAVPLLWFAWDQLATQRTAPATDPHVIDEPHYAGAAAVVLVLVGLAAIAARRPPDWRLPAWLAGLGAVVLGIGALLFPAYVSSFGTAGGAAVLIAGLVWLGVAEREAAPQPR